MVYCYRSDKQHRACIVAAGIHAHARAQPRRKPVYTAEKRRAAEYAERQQPNRIAARKLHRGSYQTQYGCAQHYPRRRARERVLQSGRDIFKKKAYHGSYEAAQCNAQSCYKYITQDDSPS